MKFRTKVVVYMIIMLAIIFGAGSSALIYNSFNGALQREKASVKQSYEMLVNTLKVVNSTKTWTDSSEISKKYIMGWNQSTKKKESYISEWK